MESLLFTPFEIKNLHFKNRIIRSSIGGRTSYYDGTVTSAFKNFEKRFAEHDVAGIISATISVNHDRTSPMEYPRLSHDRYIKPLAAAIKAVHEFDCRYIIQIGDTGGATHTSLFSQRGDARSSSTLFDLFYGYQNWHKAMRKEEIQHTVQQFADFKQEIGLPVISNGGYQDRDIMENSLQQGKADLLAMARPLLANVDLLRQFRQGANTPANPCSHCNRCIVRTANFPLGCYDRSRFHSQKEMEDQIMSWSADSDEQAKLTF